MKMILKTLFAAVTLQVSFAAMAVCNTDDDGNSTDPYQCAQYQAEQGKSKANAGAANNIANGAQTIGAKFIDASCNPTQGTCRTYSACPEGMTCTSVSSYGADKASQLSSLQTNTVSSTPRRTAITDAKNPQTWGATLQGDIQADRTARQNARNGNSVNNVKTVDPDTGAISYPAGTVSAKELAAISAHENARNTNRSNRDNAYVTQVSSRKTAVTNSISASSSTHTYSTPANDPYKGQFTSSHQRRAIALGKEEGSTAHATPTLDVAAVGSLHEKRKLARQLRVITRKEAANTAAEGAVLNEF